MRQKLFVYYYIETRNATKAAELAGYSGDRNTIASIGWENLQKPAIKSAIDEFYAQKLASPARILAEASEIAILPASDLAGKGNPQPYNADHKLKAIELVGKHHKLWTDKVESTSELSAPAIATEVVSLLVQLAERNRAAQMSAQQGVDGSVDGPVDQAQQLAGESGASPAIDVTATVVSDDSDR
jgi:phage terminase small subunit